MIVFFFSAYVRLELLNNTEDLLSSLPREVLPVCIRSVSFFLFPLHMGSIMFGEINSIAVLKMLSYIWNLISSYCYLLT